MKASVPNGRARDAEHLWLWLLGMALLSVGGAWLGWRSAPVPVRASKERAPLESTPVALPVQVEARALLSARAAPERTPPSVVSARPPAAEADEEPHFPHPLTPQHERIFRENNLVGALNDALDRGDAIRLRRLNAEYRQEYPEDGQVLQDGYELIADCIERPTASSAQAGRRFWQNHRASTLRRYVRRHCFTD